MKSWSSQRRPEDQPQRADGLWNGSSRYSPGLGGLTSQMREPGPEGISKEEPVATDSRAWPELTWIFKITCNKHEGNNSVKNGE